MAADEVDQLLRRAAPAPTSRLDVGAIEQRAHRHRHRRHARLTAAGLLVLGLVIGLAAVLPDSAEHRTVVAGPPSANIPVELTADTATMELRLLDGTRLRVTLPETVGRGLTDLTFSDLELAGSLYPHGLGPRGWRLDVVIGSIEGLVPDGQPLRLPASSEATAARVDRAGRRLGLQFGPWAAVASGDSLDEADIEDLLADIALAGTPDGFVEYRGSMPVWIVDSPDARLDGRDVTVSAFMRDCSASSVRPTAPGLVFERVDNPARGSQLTTFCDVRERIELHLDSPRQLTDEEIDRVDIEVLSVGPTLRAVQETLRAGGPR